MTDQQDRGNLKRERKKRKHVEAKKIRLLGRKKGKKKRAWRGFEEEDDDDESGFRGRADDVVHDAATSDHHVSGLYGTAVGLWAGVREPPSNWRSNLDVGGGAQINLTANWRASSLEPQVANRMAGIFFSTRDTSS